MKHAVVSLLLLTACDDALDQRLAIITEPRVLAVITEPPEAKPGSLVSYRVVGASPAGPLALSPAWAFCTAPKPPTEDNAVSVACLDESSLVPLGTGESTSAALPGDGCIEFGPDVPGTGFRPRDPDVTGGYYQPVRLATDSGLAFALTRITCKLPGAPAELARRYDLEYRANTNPVLDPIALPREIAAASDVTLTATWPAATAESFLWFDPLAQRLVDRRESLRVSWYATAGSIDVDASAAGENDEATSVTTTWHAPATPGPATVWYVLRDSRGGLDLQTITVDVR